MKPFIKSEKISIGIIFAVLIAISIPNFVISLRRARDQVRRDDMGALVNALGRYQTNLHNFPMAASDGRIESCLKPGDKPVQNEKGFWTFDAIPCDWGKESFKNPVTNEIYMDLFPREPDYQKGATYLYFSDGDRYHIYASMEGLDEPEIDQRVISLGLKCGTKICNVARSYGVPDNMSIEEYDRLNGVTINK